MLPGALGPLLQPCAPSGYQGGLVTTQQPALCSLLRTYGAVSTQTPAPSSSFRGALGRLCSQPVHALGEPSSQLKSRSEPWDPACLPSGLVAYTDFGGTRCPHFSKVFALDEMPFWELGP